MLLHYSDGGYRQTRTTKFLFLVISLCLTIALSLFLVRELPVKAHAFLLRSDPADNSNLEVPPIEIKLWFTETILSEFSSVNIYDQNGTQFRLVKMHGDPADPTLLVVEPEPLENGVFTVNWRVISATDGHLSSGTIVFGVGNNPGNLSGSGGSQSTTLPAISQESYPEIILRWLNYLGLMILVGIAGVLTFIYPCDPSREQDDPTRAIQARVCKRSLKLGIITGLSVIGIGMLMVAWQANSLIGDSASGNSLTSMVWQILLNSPWGYAWVFHQIFLIGLVLLFILLLFKNQIRSFSLAGIDLLILGVMATQAMVSHASGLTNPLLPVLIDFLHLLFAGLWIGGLITLAAGLLPIILLKKGGEDKAYLSELIRQSWSPFSRLALLSVVILTATGLYNTGSQVISADALFLNPYGKTILIKVGVMLGVGMIGLLNSMVLHPRLASPLARCFKKPAGWTPLTIKQFPTMVLVEVTLGIFILLLVGILTTLPPARSPEYAINPLQQTDPMIQPVNDLWVKLSIKPNQPGLNIFNVDVVNTSRPAPAETLRVILRLTYLDQDFGTISQDAEFTEQTAYQDSYRLSGSYLSQPGNWGVEVIVRRKGLPDSRAYFPWTVMPPGGYKSPLISRFAWQNALSITAYILMAAILAGVILIAVRSKARSR